MEINMGSILGVCLCLVRPYGTLEGVLTKLNVPKTSRERHNTRKKNRYLVRSCMLSYYRQVVGSGADNCRVHHKPIEQTVATAILAK